MKNNNLNKYFITKEDLPLFESAATFSFCQVLLKKKMHRTVATFDLYVRDMPQNRNFLIFGGLEEVALNILEWKFTDRHLKILLKNKIIDKKFAAYLKKFKFSGTLKAMKEGTIFFPGETIIRITAPIIEANLFLIFLCNAVASNTIFMSKTIRSVLAAKEKTLLTNGGRAQGFEAGIKYVRASYLVGFAPALQLSPLVKHQIEIPNIIKSTFHAYIKAFSSEYEAFKAFTDEFPDNEATLIVDTYNFENGVKNAIKICQYLKIKNKKIAYIFIDSGDLHARSVYARKLLDKADFKDVKILVASNLNEWRIKKLIDKKTPCDAIMAITELVTSYDDPKLEIVYKMAELREGNKVRQTMKLAKNKISLPGRKQIYRIEKNNKFVKDIIGLDNEKIIGEKLLKTIIKNGKLVYTFPKLEEIKKYIKSQINKLPEKYKRLETQKNNYQVEISKKLNILIKETKLRMK